MYLMPERKKSTVTHRLYIVHWYLQKSIIGTMIKYTQWQNILKATYFLKGNVVTSTKSFKELLFEPLTARRIKPVHPKGNQSWIFIGRTDAEAEASNILATWCEELTHLKRPWCRERLKAGGEGDNRGWDGWMTSLTQWTWVWVSSRSWTWTGKPGVLHSMGLQRVGNKQVTKLNCFS